ncbi:MAG: hydroxymethylbilane synthase [Candidatus Omnitrophica bacterium]|nr:hydroxymethylbilane synthase [Candidatus Omnitrophota bacterium]
MKKTLRLGARPSPLSLKQVDEIKDIFPFIDFEVLTYQTQGDRDKHTPFTGLEGSDFFTRRLEEALLKNEIDVAVHSAKDLEENPPSGLTIAAITASISPYECLVSCGNKLLGALKPGSKVATSSSKRKNALLRYRSDLEICDVRGNIEERLYQLDAGKFDALIVAHAALIRLGLENRIAEIIPDWIIPAHPLQGSLALQVRSDNQGLIDLFSVVSNTPRLKELRGCALAGKEKKNAD